MGRPKGYDRDELVDRSVAIFREHGYAGTSTSLLEEQLSVNRSSTYAEFGDKRSLFDEALARYDAANVEPRFAPLEAPEADLNTIVGLFDFYGDATDGPAFGRGRLMCNTAIEFGPLDPSGLGAVPRYLERIERAFRATLTTARHRGELRDGVDADVEAAFLTTSVLGLFVLLRAGAPAGTIAAAARGAATHVEGLRATR